MKNIHEGNVIDFVLASQRVQEKRVKARLTEIFREPIPRGSLIEAPTTGSKALRIIDIFIPPGVRS